MFAGGFCGICLHGQSFISNRLVDGKSSSEWSRARVCRVSVRSDHIESSPGVGDHVFCDDVVFGHGYHG